MNWSTAGLWVTSNRVVPDSIPANSWRITQKANVNVMWKKGLLTWRTNDLMEDSLTNFSIECCQGIIQQVDLCLLVNQPGVDQHKKSFSTRNLARATLCFCPPDKLIPFSPISVLSPAAISWVGDVKKIDKKTSLEPADLAQVHRHGLSLHNDQVHKLSQKECSPCTALPICSVQLCKTTWNSHWQKPESEILNPGLLSKESSWSWHVRAASKTRHLTCLILMLRYILPLTNQVRRPGGMISQLQLVRQSQQVGLGWLPGSPGCPSRITWNSFCHLWEGWWRRIRPGEGSRVYFNSSCFRCKRHSLSRNKD